MGVLFSSLWQRLFGYKEFKVCVVGLDNAGKTTTLFQL
jgi:GTPase SAR1 family protein